MLFESLMPKMKKICFSIFSCYNLTCNSNLTLKFCVVLRIAIEKSHAKKLEKSIHAFPIYGYFSYICAAKPVGRLDPIKLERVK